MLCYAMLGRGAAAARPRLEPRIGWVYGVYERKIICAAPSARATWRRAGGAAAVADVGGVGGKGEGGGWVGEVVRGGARAV